jgi:hypothetical protein
MEETIAILSDSDTLRRTGRLRYRLARGEGEIEHTFTGAMRRLPKPA